MNTYRSSYGNNQFASVKSAEEVPPRFPRTSLTPFGDMQHESVHSIGADYTENRYPTESTRHAYHGRGNDAPWNKIAPRALAQSEAPAKPRSPRADQMFDTLTHQAVASHEADAWIGNILIDPKAGKAATRLPPDPKGRKDLFDVLNQRNPGKPRDDSWLGHSLIDPAKGRKHNEDPAAREGRKDLFPIIQQGALHVAPQGGPAPRGKDPLGDKWIGHREINPRGGKVRLPDAFPAQTRIERQAFDWTSKVDNQIVKDEVGIVGKRAIAEFREVPPVGGLITMDPAFPLSPHHPLARRVAPPKERPGVVGTGYGQKGCVPEVTEVKFFSHHDLYWHGDQEEARRITKKTWDTMHREPDKQIPKLRPRTDSKKFIPAGTSSRVRAPPMGKTTGSAAAKR